MLVDKASNGSIILKSPNEVEELYETMVANNALCPFRRATYKKLTGIHEIDAISKLLEQIFSLEKNVIDHLTLKNPSNVLQIKFCVMDTWKSLQQWKMPDFIIRESES